MDTLATPTPAAPVAPTPARPVLAHTTVRPLPKHSVLIAVLIAASLPLILLILTIVVMISMNYNFLNWLE